MYHLQQKFQSCSGLLKKFEILVREETEFADHSRLYTY